MGDALALLGVALASALVPLVNIELYLIGLAAVSSGGHVWFLAAVGGAGQMIGKLVWYYLGANSLSWGWVRRKMDKPRAQERLTRWQARTATRPVLAGALVLGSAFSGFPPFAILSVLAGQLRMNVALFFMLGLVGRWLRFAGVLGGAEWLTAVIR